MTASAIREMILRMSDGNPGALVTIGKLIVADKIESLARLSAAGIHGSRIWVLFKDVCGEDIPRMQAVLRRLDPRVSQTLLHAEGNADGNDKEWLFYVQSVADEPVAEDIEKEAR